MNYKFIAPALATVIIFATFNTTASAQYYGESGAAEMMASMSRPEPLPSGIHIASSGSAKLTITPSAMKVGVKLSARGETLEATLTKLSEKMDVARLQLEQLDADLDSLKFSPPSIESADSTRQKAIEMLIEQRKRAGLDVPEGLKLSTTVSVSSMMSVDFPLPELDDAATLVHIEKLQKHIKDAKLAGEDDKSDLPAEEQEIIEEMIGQMMEQISYSSRSEESNPGEPHFVFIGKISEEEQAALTVEAIKNAKDMAAKLAKAAGQPIDRMTSLSAKINTSTEGAMEVRYDRYGNPRMSRVQHDEGTIMSSEPNRIIFQIVVSATFATKAPETP